MAGDLGFRVRFFYYFILWTERLRRKKKKKGGDVERLLGRPKILVGAILSIFLAREFESRWWPDRYRPVGSPSASASSSAGPCTHCPLPYQQQEHFSTWSAPTTMPRQRPMLRVVLSSVAPSWAAYWSSLRMHWGDTQRCSRAEAGASVRERTVAVARVLDALRAEGSRCWRGGGTSSSRYAPRSSRRRS